MFFYVDPYMIAIAKPELRKYLSTYTPSTRKKKKGDDSGMLPDDEFEELALKLLDDIEEAINPILPLNPGYKFEYNEESNQLLLHVGRKGSYSFKIDPERQSFILFSPVSGLLNYKYNVEEKLWLGIHDNHDFRGLITRDLIRHGAGVPMFK